MFLRVLPMFPLIKTICSTPPPEFKIFFNLSVFVSFLQCLHRFRLFLCRPGESKSSSNIQSCRACSGRQFGYGKLCRLKEINKYDRMNNSQSVVHRGFNAYLTSVHLLALKRNHDGSEAPKRLPRWLGRGITFSLLMD